MGRFTQSLRNLLPRTGRMIKEDGSFFNEADLLALKQRQEVSTQSMLSKAYRASYKVDIAQSGGQIDFVLNIPAGIVVDFHARTQTAYGGVVNWQLYMKPDPWYSVLESFRGYNFDETLGGKESKSIIDVVDGATTGAVFRTEDLIVPGGTGTNKTAATFTNADAIPRYDSNNKPMLRVINDSTTTDATVVFNWVWVEFEEGA